jgi:hypothetical protein
MTAVLIVTAAFFLGLFLGALVSAARDYYDEQADSDAQRDQLVAQADNDAYRDELVRQWREGYRHGWTCGRVVAVEEQQAKASHPTSHPLGEVIRIEHRRKDELDDLWGGD